MCNSDPSSPRPGITFQSLSSLNPPKGLYLIPSLKCLPSVSPKFTPTTLTNKFTTKTEMLAPGIHDVFVNKDLSSHTEVPICIVGRDVPVVSIIENKKINSNLSTLNHNVKEKNLEIYKVLKKSEIVYNDFNAMNFKEISNIKELSNSACTIFDFTKKMKNYDLINKEVIADDIKVKKIEKNDINDLGEISPSLASLDSNNKIPHTNSNLVANCLIQNDNEKIHIGESSVGNIPGDVICESDIGPEKFDKRTTKKGRKNINKEKNGFVKLAGRVDISAHKEINDLEQHETNNSGKHKENDSGLDFSTEVINDSDTENEGEKRGNEKRGREGEIRTKRNKINKKEKTKER